MKTKSSIIFITIIFISFSSCEKEITPLNTAEQELKSEFVFNNKLKIGCSEKGFVNLLVSSNDSAILSNFLSIYTINLNPLKTDYSAQKTEYVSKEAELTYTVDYPNDLVEISIEVIDFSKEYESEDLILSFIKKDRFLKANPPTNYYIGYKAKIKRKYLGLKYFPVANDDSGIIFKWGYTNCWLCQWHFDEQWRWIEGYINYEWAMNHPYSNRGYYRLAVELYTNTYSNFDIKESDDPIIW
ncbi:MAG: hypothetical protein ACFCUM_06375 [Bacteroidales bacterium]